MPAESEPKILSGSREITHAQLRANVARAATAFTNLGIRPQDAVAMMLRNDFPYFEVTMAANSLGAYAVPVNWHFTADEAGYILRDCDARALVIHSDLYPRVRAAIPADTRVFIVTTPPEIRAAYDISDQQARRPAELPEWIDWIGSFEPAELPPIPPPSSMIYTSGTTGNPKGVRRHPYDEASAAVFNAMVAAIFGFQPDGGFRTVVTGPMYHSAPNAYGLYAVRNGGFCVLQPRFDPEELLQWIERYQITHMHMVPTMFIRLLRLPDETKKRYDLSSLKFISHAAAPCPADVKRAMIEWWGPVINEYYGATETGGIIFNTSEEALRKPGTVGRPIPGATMRIYDPEGNPLGPGQVGEVYLALEGMADFTYHRLDEKRREVERDGLITAGDVGYIDEDGYLFLCDRKRDMVISGGVNIYPAEIEAALVNMPGVHDSAVFGIPHAEFGESLCAYIEPQPGADLTPDAVRAFLSGKVAHYKIPRLIEFADQLPREDSGKIFKRKLRAPYWENAGRQI